MASGVVSQDRFPYVAQGYILVPKTAKVHELPVEWHLRIKTTHGQSQSGLNTGMVLILR